MDRSAWIEQEHRWRRFAEWESGQSAMRVSDYRRALEWMAHAWELASRYNPNWGSEVHARRHWEYLAEVRRRLARGSRSQ